MTVLEMIEGVKMGIDKSNSIIDSVNFTEDEILYWLNEAQIQLVKQKMFGNNYRHEGFDTLHGGAVTKRSDDLSNLIRYSRELEYQHDPAAYPYFRPHRYHPNIAVVNIVSTVPDGSTPAPTMPHYMFYVGADFKVKGKSAPLETVVIEQKDINDFVETPTNKPYLRNAFVYLKEGEINVIYDPYVEPEWLYVSYLMEPKKLALDKNHPRWITNYENIFWNSEEDTKGLLMPQVHPEIVALAVNLILENIADPRYQSHNIEITKKE